MPNPPFATDQLALLEAGMADSPVGFAMIDRDLRYVCVNRALGRIHARPPEAIIGKSVADLVPDLWPTLEPIYRRAFAGEPVTSHRVFGAVGEHRSAPRHFATMHFPVVVNGEIVAVGLHVTDVTDRADAERALTIRTDLYAMLSRTNGAIARCRTREALFRELCTIAIETGHFQYAWIGVPEDGRVASIASAGEDHGYVDRISITLDPEDPRSHGPTGRAFATGQAFFINDFESDPTTSPWHEPAHHAGFRASAALPLRERGRVTAVLTIYAPVTGFFTDHLIDALHQLRSTVSAALDAIANEGERERLVHHLQERIKELGLLHATSRLLQSGRPLDRALLGEIVALVPPAWQYPDTCVARIRVGDVEVTTPRWRETPWMQSASFVAGGSTGAVSVAYLTEQPAEAEGPFLSEERALLSSFAEMLRVYQGHQMESDERARVEMQLRHSQKIQALGTLAGGIAHDFNNILAAILGNAELALGQADRDSRVGEYIREISRAGERASDLVRRILVFARHQESQRRSIDLRQPVEEAVRLLRASLPAAIRIETQFTPRLPLVQADATQLHQVVMNLGTNSGHAMRAGGVLTIALSASEVDEVTASAVADLQAGPHVQLTVRDSGEGMSRDVLERVFEPFFTTKGPDVGTGLGLSVVHGIVRSHGGALAIESSPARGTIVRIWFPVASVPAPEPVPVTAATFDGGGVRVIYVDDEEAVLQVMQQRIALLGYRVTGFSSPALALQAFLSNPGGVDALVTDMDMPEMTGVTLADAVRRVRPELPIAITSGMAGMHTSEFDFSRFSVILPKPCTRGELAEALRVLTGAR